MMFGFRSFGKTNTVNGIGKLRHALEQADAVIIGAGAGLSTSAGFVYTGERFEKHFHDFAEKYHFNDMYSGGFYPYDTLEEVIGLRGEGKGSLKEYGISYKQVELTPEGSIDLWSIPGIVSYIHSAASDTYQSEEKVLVGGVLLRLTDTAGIRDSGDRIEAMGVERSRQAAQRASLALLVLDGSQALSEEDEQAIAAAQRVPNLLVLVNKGDLPRRLDIGQLADRFDNVLTISARTGEGLDTLSDAVAALYPAGETPAGELLTNARQADAANRALSAVAEARSALRIGMTADVVLTDCESALAALGELNGKQVRDDLIDTIFSRFCVGK